MRRGLGIVGGVVAVVVLAASCSSTHRQTHLSAKAGTAVNPYVVPAVITPAYVDAVFVVLNHIIGNATRGLVRDLKVTPEVRADLLAVYADGPYEAQIQAAQESLKGVVDNVRVNPGDPVTTVTRLIGWSPTCVFVSTRTNLQAVLVAPVPEPASEYFELIPKSLGNDPGHLNPTPWAIGLDVAFPTPHSLPDKCA
jgi:hypothetical protein